MWLNKVYEAFGGRRYFFAQQVFLAAILLRLVDKIEADNFVELTVWTLVIYSGANVVQKFIDKKVEKNEKPNCE